MNREDRSREPRAPHTEAEAAEDRPEQENRPGVQEQVRQMVWPRAIAEDRVLGPEARVGEGVVLLIGEGVGPDPEQSMKRAERLVRRDVPVVVPDESVPERRQVDHDRQEQKAEPLRQRAPRPGFLQQPENAGPSGRSDRSWVGPWTVRARARVQPTHLL